MESWTANNVEMNEQKNQTNKINHKKNPDEL